MRENTVNEQGNSVHWVTVGLPGVVYFVRAGDSIKIGAATNFKHRLHALQTGNEKPLEVLAVIPGLNEYEIHQRFSHLRTFGEWFSPKKELLDFIEFAKLTYGEATYEIPKRLPVRPQPPKLQKQKLTERQKSCAAMLNAYETTAPATRESMGFILRRNLASLVSA